MELSCSISKMTALAILLVAVLAHTGLSFPQRGRTSETTANAAISGTAVNATDTRGTDTMTPKLSFPPGHRGDDDNDRDSWNKSSMKLLEQPSTIAGFVLTLIFVFVAIAAAVLVKRRRRKEEKARASLLEQATAPCAASACNGHVKTNHEEQRPWVPARIFRGDHSRFVADSRL